MGAGVVGRLSARRTTPAPSGGAGTGLQGAGLTLVMTDLFISAAGALVIVLALARTDAPRPVPVQADLVALCPDPPGGALRLTTPERLSRDGAGADGPAIGDAAGLRAGVERLLPPSLFVTLALVDLPARPVTPACLARTRGDILRPYALALQVPDAAVAPAVAMTVVAAPAAAPGRPGAGRPGADGTAP